MTDTYTPTELDWNATSSVAGHRGPVGSAIWRSLTAAGFTQLVGRTSAELDLRDRDATFALLVQTRLCIGSAAALAMSAYTPLGRSR